ncbi:MAG: glycosyltransferase family 4 protein [Rhodothermales bacterium]
MHIGYFTHSPVRISETFIHDLVHALNERAERLTFFSGASSGCQLPGIRVFETGYFDRFETHSHRLHQIGQAFRRQGDLLRFRYAQAGAARVIRTYAEELTSIDAAFVEYGTSAALLAPTLRSFSIPYVVQVHAFDVTTAFSSAHYKAAFLEAARHATAVTVVSDHIRRILILAGVAPETIHTVRLGIRSEGIEPLDWEARRRRPPTLVHLGRLTEKKHPIALLHAFDLVRREVPEARLALIGDGPLRGEVERRMDALGLRDAVTMYGAVGREVSFPVLNSSWVFAQHSVTSMTGDQEGFPVSPAEAALHALPVVATAHSGLTENVVDGETGFLVQEHNFEAMGARIAHLMKHPEEAERMGRAGRERILAMCRPERHASQILELLERAAGTRAGATKTGAPLALTSL